jgi:hypothetical protein
VAKRSTAFINQAVDEESIDRGWLELWEKIVGD